MGVGEKAHQLVLIQIHLTDVTLIVFIVSIIGAAFTAAGCFLLLHVRFLQWMFLQTVPSFFQGFSVFLKDYRLTVFLFSDMIMEISFQFFGFVCFYIIPFILAQPILLGNVSFCLLSLFLPGGFFMSARFSSWVFHPALFFSFFKKYPADRKLLAAALTGLPPELLLSAVWYTGSLCENGFCLRVRTDSGEFFLLEIIPFFSRSASFASPLPFSSPQPGFPEKFLRIFFLFQEPDQKNPFFYGNFTSSGPSLSCRSLNLSALQPVLPAFPDLYAFSLFLLVRQASELPLLSRHFPILASAAPLLEEVLQERDRKALFAKHALFSPEDSRGISAMCSVNRLLLREKRFDELQKVSDDPEALEKLFLDFREKGFL